MRHRRILIITMLLAPLLAVAGGFKFELPDIHGKKTHSLQDYKGKWIVINYWATWCPPCLDEIPELVEFHDAHSKKDAVVLGVNHEELDRDYLVSFVDEFFITYPVLVSDPYSQPPFGRLYGLPTTYIISPEGELVTSKTGAVSKATLEEIIAQHSKKRGK
jgi:thiol-disulfide isomerase/thioredoxin